MPLDRLLTKNGLYDGASIEAFRREHMWECLTIEDKLRVLLSGLPPDHPEAPALFQVRDEILKRYAADLPATRYREEPEAAFWREIYRFSDEAQILVMQSYDSFNADAAHRIDLKRPDPEYLWAYRQGTVEDFYSGVSMKLKMLKHIVHRSGSLHDAAACLTLFGRKYDPRQKVRKPA
jgi:hypothetical protein